MAIGKKELMYNKNVSEKVQRLSSQLESAKDENEFFEYITGFYKDILRMTNSQKGVDILAQIPYNVIVNNTNRY